MQSSWHTEPCSKTLTGPRAIGYVPHTSESYKKRKYRGLSAGSTWFLKVSPVQCNRTGICSWLPGQSSDIHLSNLCWLNTCCSWGCRWNILASRTVLVLTILLVIFQLNKTLPAYFDLCLYLILVKYPLLCWCMAMYLCDIRVHFLAFKSKRIFTSCVKEKVNEFLCALEK